MQMLHLKCITDMLRGSRGTVLRLRVRTLLSGEQTRTWHRWMVKMAWERELWTFIWVLAVVRDKAPSFRHCIIC